MVLMLAQVCSESLMWANSFVINSVRKNMVSVVFRNTVLKGWVYV